MEWQPIDTVPKDGTHVLLTQEGGVELGWWVAEERGIYETVRESSNRRVQEWVVISAGYWGGVEKIYEPTHWMPLPKPPSSS